MKLAPLLVASLLLGVAFVALAPSVDARAFCSNTVDDWCEDTLCIHSPNYGVDRCSSDPIIVCIREPCP